MGSVHDPSQLSLAPQAADVVQLSPRGRAVGEHRCEADEMLAIVLEQAGKVELADGFDRREKESSVLEVAATVALVDQVCHKSVGNLNVGLQQTKDEVSMWLSAVARCTTALDELTVLELTHYATIAPEKVNTKRLALDAARQSDEDELYDGIASFIRRMDKTADNANQNKILHTRGVPKAILSLEAAKTVVRTFCEALDVRVDWINVDSKQWLAAIRERRQWKNAATESASKAWEKGKPVLGLVAITAVTALVNKRFPIKPGSV